ncbi:MAG: hypothetical protein E4H17_04465, partial [Gemmatimonadales bacterium]
MRTSLSVLMVLGLLGATVGCSAAAGSDSVHVWAAGDGVRVNPETGKFFEDRPDIHKDYPTGDYRKRSAVWDASAGRVALKAARNEFVSFQVVVEKGDSHPADQTVKPAVTCTSLRGPDGAEIAGANVAPFKAWYVKVNRKTHGYDKLSLGLGWYPDALIPVAQGRPLSFDLPDAKNAIGPTQRNQTVWVDIFVPRDRKDAPPGTYKGELAVAWPGGSRTIDVELDVWDFALPDDIHCRGDIFNVTLLDMAPEKELL